MLIPEQKESNPSTASPRRPFAKQTHLTQTDWTANHNLQLVSYELKGFSIQSNNALSIKRATARPASQCADEAEKPGAVTNRHDDQQGQLETPQLVLIKIAYVTNCYVPCRSYLQIHLFSILYQISAMIDLLSLTNSVICILVNK